MADDRLEELLRGYRLPDTSTELDRRVLEQGAAILAPVSGRSLVEDLGHALLHRLGFGYVAWFIDLVTTTDAEYRVELV